MPPENYIVSICFEKGRRIARRHRLSVPLDAATGHYHRLADRTLNDLIKDLRHEQRRRAGELFDGQESESRIHTPRGFNPAGTQFAGDDE